MTSDAKTQDVDNSNAKLVKVRVDAERLRTRVACERALWR
jgi:hypothetical protein